MNKKIKILIVLLFILAGCSNSSIKTGDIKQTEKIQSDKFTVSVGEDFFNLFLKQIGDINGEQRVKMSKLLKLIKVEEDIKWQLKEMRIDIEEDETLLYGKIIIEIKGEVVESSFKSKVEMEYNNEEEKLKVTPKEMRIKKLANIDITDFYSPVFEVKVSNPFNKEVKLKMPDGNYKSVLINTNAEIKAEKDRIEIIMKYNNQGDDQDVKDRTQGLGGN